MPITMTLAHTADLALPLKKVHLQSGFLTGDALSHRFQVDVCRAGTPVQLSGAAVTGYFIRPDGATVSIPGLAEDSCVTLTLPAACYRLPGRFSLVIRLMQDDVKTAVFWAEGAMALSATDTLVDDGVIPSLDELLARIDAMEAATAAANEAADTVLQKLNSGELHGKGLTILGYYDTLGMLTAAVSQPAVGDAYAIGLQAPYNIYIWSGTDNEWIDNGPLQGVPGDTGPQGEPGRDGADAARNLLDNSNFGNVVNQRGQSSYTANGYTIDRWAIGQGSSVTINERSITVSGSMVQYVEGIPEGAVLTFAYGDGDAAHFGEVGYEASSGLYSVTLPAGTWTWAALYEGAYTADTLPAYIPKGYAAELLACERYFQVVHTLVSRTGVGVDAPGRLVVPLTPGMRINPTVSYTVTSGVAPDWVIATQKYIDVKSGSTHSQLTLELSADL